MLKLKQCLNDNAPKNKLFCNSVKCLKDCCSGKRDQQFCPPNYCKGSQKCKYININNSEKDPIKECENDKYYALNKEYCDKKIKEYQKSKSKPIPRPKKISTPRPITDDSITKTTRKRNTKYSFDRATGTFNIDTTTKTYRGGKLISSKTRRIKRNIRNLSPSQRKFYIRRAGVEIDVSRYLPQEVEEELIRVPPRVPSRPPRVPSRPPREIQDDIPEEIPEEEIRRERSGPRISSLDKLCIAKKALQDIDQEKTINGLQFLGSLEECAIKDDDEEEIIEPFQVPSFNIYPIIATILILITIIIISIFVYKKYRS